MALDNGAAAGYIKHINAIYIFRHIRYKWYLHMDKQEIISILDKWNFWNQKINTGFQRSGYLGKMERYLKMPEIIALTGVRRSGKSTIILQVIEKLIQSGVKPTNTLYVNFEEPKFGSGSNDALLPEIFDAYMEFFDPKGKVYLFLDEVQLIYKWERFAVSLHDRRENIKIFVTGSSSKLLMGEISSLLSGRYISETIYPLSFKEFLAAENIKTAPLIKSPRIYKKLREYVEFGGFPRVALEKDIFNKKIILTEYFNSILEKDVILKHAVKNVKDIKELINFVLSNVANEVSSYNVEKLFGISSQNARRYFEHLNEAFLFQFSPFFSFSVKKQIYNPQKVFAIDTGLVNAASFKFSDDIGRLLENIVAVEFLRRNQRLFYWKNGTEIDFVLRIGRQADELVNVCYSLNKRTLAREIESLERGLSEFKEAKAKLIYWEGKPVKHDKIEFQNILDFLLASAD
jgi:hypothetical protein